MEKYNPGGYCDKQSTCKIEGCQSCDSKKLTGSIDVFVCANKQSKNYNQEVYKDACCFYICRRVEAIDDR